MFYVDRRASMVRVHNHTPFNLGRFPQALAGFERLNDRQVDYSPTITIRGDQYNLRSVVISEVNRNLPNQNVVVGSSTAAMIHSDPHGVVDFPQAAGAAAGFHNRPVT